MPFEFVNSAVVALVEDVRPAVLHPSSLERIVPSEWQVVEGPVSTPPFAYVKYSSGLSLTAEMGKLMVVDESDLAGKETSNSWAFAPKFLRLMAAARIRAIGINFAMLVQADDPGRLLRSRFVVDGPWCQPPNKLEAVSLGFAYDLSPGVLRVQCDPGRVLRALPTDLAPRLVTGVVLNLNFHVDLVSATLDEAEVEIRRFSERLKHAERIVESMFGD